MGIIDTLNDTMNRVGDTDGLCDRSSQYCSADSQNLLKAGGFVCSMSEKGNCWDNAPTESFWGKLKQERLNEQNEFDISVKW